MCVTLNLETSSGQPLSHGAPAPTVLQTSTTIIVLSPKRAFLSTVV